MVINSDIQNSIVEKAKAGRNYPIHKKNDTFTQKNYFPASILPNVSNIFELIMHKQMGMYLEIYFNTAQHAVIHMLENGVSLWTEERSDEPF